MQAYQLLDRSLSLFISKMAESNPLLMADMQRVSGKAFFARLVSVSPGPSSTNSRVPLSNINVVASCQRTGFATPSDKSFLNSSAFLSTLALVFPTYGIVETFILTRFIFLVISSETERRSLQ
ncbi:hypothetical protein D3C75_735230 [compost metagenome]